MNRLKELRIKHGLSLRKLQEFTDIDFSRLAVIEKTDANLESKTIEKLTDFFKVSSTYLFGKDGLIYYYDDSRSSYFSMAYEQYKNVLTDDVVSFSIVDGCVRRTISCKGYERIEDFDGRINNAITSRLTTNKYLQFLDSLSEIELQQQKERLIEYFKSKERGHKLKK